MNITVSRKKALLAGAESEVRICESSIFILGVQGYDQTISMNLVAQLNLAVPDSGPA